MSLARILSSVVPLVAVCAALLAPAGAGAHSTGLGDGDGAVDAAAAATHEAQLARALAELPRETSSGTCVATEHVAGVGDACRTDEGAFRVRLADGVTITTHGTDAPPDAASRAAAAPHLPDSQAAIDGAGVADVECTTAPGDRRVELVYARPADKPDRSATLADPMRTALYRSSAFLDAEAQSLDPDQGRRIRVLCEGGVPKVHSVTVRASGSSGGDYDEIVDDLVAQGYPAPVWNTTSTRRFMVFYDDASTTGAAGIGGMWLDDSAGSTNPNNRGGRYAVEFDWSSSRLPHWDVFLHEMSHNMGAVSDAAPDASGAGHCNDGIDIMCYDDGGAASSYTETSCTVERYDCGGDSYFNPSPAAGSWLATHWNVGSADNQWLAVRDLGWDDGGVPDSDPPSVPTSPAASAITTTSITLTWGASSDARSIVRYRVAIDSLESGAWQLHSTIAPISQPTLTVGSLTSAKTYRFRITAYDQAGNSSAPAELEAAAAAAPPVAPASAALSVVDGTTLSAAWVAGSSAVGVRGHEVELQRGADAWTRVGEFAGTTAQLTGLESGRDHRIRVRTVANGGATSTWRTSTYVRTPGTLAGGGDGGDGASIDAPVVSVRTLGPTRATASWTASPAAASWELTLVSASGAARTIRVASTSVLLSGLSHDSNYAVSVIASSPDGSVRSDSGFTSFRTPRDTARPGLSRFARPTYRRTTMRVAWTAAADESGIARYELQRRAGRRWVRVRLKPGPTRVASVTGVRRRSSVTLRVRAIDRAGNVGRWATTTVRRR